MTCGIYKLNFKGTDMCYIGQSSNIEQRFNVHKYSMLNGTSSTKLNSAYSSYGLPSYEILTECESKEELDECEKEAISIYNSINSGFNTLSDPKDIPLCKGELNGRSKTSDALIEYIFKKLIQDKDILYKELSEETGVSIPIIRRVASGQNHSWLATIYPEEYAYLMSLKNTRRAHSKITGELNKPIISPLGDIYTIPKGKVRDFCKEHSLDRAHLGKVLNGSAAQHKGWKLYNVPADNNACGNA